MYECIYFLSFLKPNIHCTLIYVLYTWIIYGNTHIKKNIFILIRLFTYKKSWTSIYVNKQIYIVLMIMKLFHYFLRITPRSGIAG